MKKITKKILLWIGLGFGITTTVSTIVLLPLTVFLFEKISFLIPEKGEKIFENWNKQTKLKYVALGDSVTAGYVGITGNEVFSYADILANNLKKTENLASYHNFAISGDTTLDQKKMFLLKPDTQKRIQEADLITLTIGANDLLSFLKFFDLPFKSQVSEIFNVQNILKKYTKDGNAVSRSISEKIIKLFKNQPSATWNESEILNMIFKSFLDMSKMFLNKDLSKIIQINTKGLEMLDSKMDVFDILKLNMIDFINLLHKVAKKAHIIVLGPAMPFAQWPDSIIKLKRADLQNHSLSEYYVKMVQAMKEGSESAWNGKNNYVHFYETDALPIYKTSNPNEDDNKDKTFKDYIKKITNASSDWKYNAMPNPADIHPSTFGYEIIGNAIYHKIAKYLNIKEEKILEKYTFSNAKDEININNPNNKKPFIKKDLNSKWKNKKEEALTYLDILDTESDLFKEIKSVFDNTIIKNMIEIIENMYLQFSNNQKNIWNNMGNLLNNNQFIKNIKNKVEKIRAAIQENENGAKTELEEITKKFKGAETKNLFLKSFGEIIDVIIKIIGKLEKLKTLEENSGNSIDFGIWILKFKIELTEKLKTEIETNKNIYIVNILEKIQNWISKNF